MGDTAGVFILLFGLVFLGFIFFVIYFIFKQLQFVIQSVNLYKDMVTRQDMMIRLLQDIRDGKKTNTPGSGSISGASATCRKCGQSSAEGSKYCDSCGAQLT